MFEVIVKLLDKAIDLIKLREKNKNEFFDLIIDPLFKEFEKVAENYFSMFNQNSPTVEELTTIRNNYIQARIKLTELVNEYKEKINDEEVCDFLESIQYFFYGQEYVPGGSQGTGGQVYIDLVSGKKGVASLEELIKMRESKRSMLEESWGNTVKFYGALKIRYKLPIGKNA